MKNRALVIIIIIIIFDIKVRENLAVGSLVASVRADYSASAAFLSYSLVRGDINGSFCIAGGDISVARPLDVETVASYELVVRVRDSRGNDTAVVKVDVTDTNDYAPTFEKPEFTVRVPEDQGRVRVVFGGSRKVFTLSFDPSRLGLLFTAFILAQAGPIKRCSQDFYTLY